MTQSQESIVKILRYNKVTPSYIRISIYDYLSREEIHPTVDEIFIDLVKTIPTLSKTTVYNTLKLFVEKNLVKAVNLGDNTMRYEFIRSNHGHFQCKACSTIYDIPIQASIDLPKELQDSIIDEHHYILKGTCSHCLNRDCE